MLKNLLAAIGAAALVVAVMSFTAPAPQDDRLVTTRDDPIERGTLVDVRVRRGESSIETFRATLESSLDRWVVFETGGTRIAMNREQIESISTVGR